MDIFSRFLERQAPWLTRIAVPISLVGGVAFFAGIFVIEPYRQLGFVLILISFWCFGGMLVENLYTLDAEGGSRMRNASPFMRVYGSVFISVWFLGLAFMSLLVAQKIGS